MACDYCFLLTIQTSGYESELSSMVSTPSAALTAGVTSDSSNGTVGMVQPLDTSTSTISVSTVVEERSVEPPPAADANWVEVQRRKKVARSERVCGVDMENR